MELYNSMIGLYVYQRNSVFYFLLLVFLFSSPYPSYAQTLAHWTIEAESRETCVTTLPDRIIDIISPKGMTLWYNDRMEGNTVIEYDARIVVEDSISEPWNRLSDLNCFWMATDMKRETLSPLDGICDRQGVFIRQYALSLYYMGFGGNHNTTTRFRRYSGDERGITDAKYRPSVLVEYTDSAHLLKSNHWYHIRLEQIDGRVRYTIDNQTIVEYQDPTPLTIGYFGFRTTLSHAQIRRFAYNCQSLY